MIRTRSRYIEVEFHCLWKTNCFSMCDTLIREMLFRQCINSLLLSGIMITNILYA